MQQLTLFSTERLARRPYCATQKASGVRIRDAFKALEHPYIQANTPALQFRIVLDVDYPIRGTAHEDWWLNDFGLPTPNWTAINPENRYGHVAYEVEVPIAKHDHARAAPLRFAAAIEDALARRLRADFGYSGLICKNPHHPTWETVVGRARPYDMPELADYLDLAPYGGKKPQREPQGPLGRNCLLFDRLRVWAYQAVIQFRSESTLEAWRAEVLARAVEWNHFHGENLQRKDPLAFAEVKATAKSVANWVWQNFAVGQHHADFIARQRYKAALGAKAAAATKRERREEAIRNAMAALIQAGELPTVRAVARTIGCSHVNLVRNYGHLFETPIQ